MIGMMYLVLTALLALNVSKEILDAFVTINSGLETTKVTFDGKLSQMYASFQNSYNENQAKYGAAWQKAQGLRTEANELVAHIDKIKAKIIAETEGLPMESVLGQLNGVDTVLNLRFVKNKDNYDVNTNIMIGPEPANPLTTDHADGYNYRAVVLRQKLETFRDNMKGMIPNDESLVRAIDSLFTFPQKIRSAAGTWETWETLNFYHVPLAATVAILSKVQTDIRNAESDVLNALFAGVDAASYKFTTLRSIVVPEKTYILQGDSFRADVFLAAYDDTNLPDIVIGVEGAKVDPNTSEISADKSRSVKIGSDGLGKLRLPANALGDKTYEGVIRFRKPQGGGYTPYPFVAKYEVAKPALVVSPIKMNVLYRGIENPIAISVPGISQEQLKATIDNGVLVKQSDGTYIAKDIKTGSKAVVSVSADIDGKTKPMGTFEFRVKSVPDPVAKFAGKSPADNSAQTSELTAALGVVADLPDFEFDLKYPIKSFDLTVIMGGNVKTLTSNSNRLTDEQRELLKQVRRNQTVIIENIRATAPDGSVRKLGSINLRVL